MTEIDESQAFNLHRVPHDPVDGEPRLRGDILVWQIIDAYVAPRVADAIGIVYGVTRLALWELPKLVVEVAILDPIQRWRKP